MAIYELETDDYAAPRARMRVYVDDLEVTAQMEHHLRNWALIGAGADQGAAHEQVCPMYAEWETAITVLRQLIDRWPDGCDCQFPTRRQR